MPRACALPAVLVTNQSQAFLSALQDLAKMAAISAVITFYRNSQVIERFRSRISFRDDLSSFNNFKRHVESFLGVKEKARALGVNCFELKLFRLARSATGASDCQNYAIYTQEKWDLVRPLLLEISGSELNGKFNNFVYIKSDH